jgi:hypothetical protein
MLFSANNLTVTTARQYSLLVFHPAVPILCCCSVTHRNRENAASHRALTAGPHADGGHIAITVVVDDSTAAHSGHVVIVKTIEGTSDPNRALLIGLYQRRTEGARHVVNRRCDARPSIRGGARLMLVIVAGAPDRLSIDDGA